MADVIKSKNDVKIRTPSDHFDDDDDDEKQNYSIINENYNRTQVQEFEKKVMCSVVNFSLRKSKFKSIRFRTLSESKGFKVTMANKKLI